MVEPQRSGALYGPKSHHSVLPVNQLYNQWTARRIVYLHGKYGEILWLEWEDKAVGQSAIKVSEHSRWNSHTVVLVGFNRSLDRCPQATAVEHCLAIAYGAVFHRHQLDLQAV